MAIHASKAFQGGYVENESKTLRLSSAKGSPWLGCGGGGALGILISGSSCNVNNRSRVGLRDLQGHAQRGYNKQEARRAEQSARQRKTSARQRDTARDKATDSARQRKIAQDKAQYNARQRETRRKTAPDKHTATQDEGARQRNTKRKTAQDSASQVQDRNTIRIGYIEKQCMLKDMHEKKSAQDSAI
jgi:hypothetical protein